MTLPEPVSGRARETALSIVVPEAEESTAAFRRRHLAGTVARRVPAHVTVLYPFADAEKIDHPLLERLKTHFASCSPIAFELARVEAFESHVWLAPEPAAQFVELIRRTYARFPEYLPYRGAFDKDKPTPHLTLGEGDVADLLPRAQQELAGSLPLRGLIDAVSLLEEQLDGTWLERTRFALGSA